MAREPREFNPLDDLPDIPNKVIYQRLAVLATICIAIGFGGFWLMQTHLVRTFGGLWGWILEYWDFIGTLAFWKGMFAWVRVMWWKWLFIEVPKRILLFSVLPYYLIRLLPARWLRWVRMRFRIMVAKTLGGKDWISYQAQRFLGDKVGWGIAMVILAFTFLIFYFAFGAYLILWIGLIKFPGWLVGVFRGIGNFFVKKLQIVSFAKAMFGFIGRWTNIFRETLLVVLTRISPKLAKRLRRRKSPEEKRRERRLKARKAISDRRNVQLFYEVRGNWGEYKRRRRAQLRENARRHRYWRAHIANLVRVPALQSWVKQPCCEHRMVVGTMADFSKTAAE